MSEKILTLLRHAKAEDHRSDDHSRVLARRGIDDVGIMSPLLFHDTPAPDAIHSSTAARAVETADRCRQTLMQTSDSAPAVDTHAELYLASARQIHQFLCNQDWSAIQHLLLVGHNPGLEMLCEEYSTRAPLGLPTAGLRQWTFEWQTDDDFAVAILRARLNKAENPRDHR